MTKLVIVDTEYTTWEGALESDWAEPWQHKEIVQIAAVKVDTDSGFSEIDYFDVLVKPKINAELSGLFTELTGIKQTTVDSRGVSFSKALHDFYLFCEEGKLPVVCMNADEVVFRKNCNIHNTAFPFKNPFHRLRPFLEGEGVDMKNKSSGSLHELTDKPINQGHVHNALHDVRSMANYMDFAKRQGTFTKLDQLPAILPTSDPRSTKGIVPKNEQ